MKVRCEMIKVVVWKSKPGVGAYNHPGHVAISLSKGIDTANYISWWPGTTMATGERRGNASSFASDAVSEIGARAQAKLDSGATPRPGQTKGSNIDWQGLRLANGDGDWMQLPGGSVDIRALEDGNKAVEGGLGLSEKNMKVWWAIVRAKCTNDVKYKFVSKDKNCAGMALAALIVGGSANFVDPPKSWFYLTPNDVYEYALKVERNITRMNQAAVAVNAEILANHQKFQPVDRNQFGTDTLNSRGGPVHDIWKTDVWTRESAVKVGRRKEQVQQIDNFVRRYWAGGEEWTISNHQEKVICLRWILNYIQSHLVEKTNSDRREAVLKLGSQVLMVMREKANMSNIWKNALVAHHIDPMLVA